MAKTKRRLGHSLLTKESSAGVLFTLPFTVGFLMFMIVPMGISLYYSFCEYNILSEPKFIGIDNFVKMFTDDAVYMTSLKVTFFFAFVSVPIRLVFALIVALILLRTTKVTGFYRAAYYLPSIIGGSVAVAILWKRMFAINGVVNALLGKIGIETNFSWLGDKRTAIWVLIPQYLWYQKLGWIGTYVPLIVPYFFAIQGFFVYLMTNFIEGIPRELDEAAKIDGCSYWGIFVNIILPLMKPALVTGGIFSFMWRWDDFLSALLYVNKSSRYPVSLALKLFCDPGSASDYGAMFAMATLSILPAVCIFIFFQKYLVEGISTSGLKG